MAHGVKLSYPAQAMLRKSGTEPSAMALTLLRDASHSGFAPTGHTIDKPLSHHRGVYMFSHTQNENGTYNTRCLYCFITIASSIETVEELDQVEKQHICPEKALADLLTHQASPVADAHSR